MPNPPTLVIVGASLAGAKAAEGARSEGFDGRIVLVGDEPTAPYERPPLSKAVLRGEADPESAHVHDEGFYADNDIDLTVGRVTALDVAARQVRLDDGSSIPFTAIVLATGAEPRRFEGPGSDLAGVHVLRTVEDAVHLRDAIQRSSRLAVVGSGWIGSEVAASARQLGTDVVLIDVAPVPLKRVLGDEVGAVFAQLHADHGVTLRLGTGVTELRGSSAVEEVVLADGRVEPADLVVVGIGVTPRTALAEAAGLAVDDGILADQHLGVAGHPDIYVAGDVANAWHPHYRRPIRVEHWANALNQGLTAGRNVAGRQEAYTRLPYFFSDQYDLGMEYVGHGAPGDSVVVRGDTTAREFIAFWHSDGLVTAAMNVNVWDVVDDLKTLIEAARPVDPALLADPDVALADLVGPPS